MDGSAVWRRFGPRFHSKIVPESMEMTSEEPRESGGRLGSVSGGSWERLGSSRTALGTAGWQNLKPKSVHRGPKSAGKAVQAGRVLHSKSRQNLTQRLTRLPGGGGLLTTPAAIHRRPLETCVRGCPRRRPKSLKKQGPEASGGSLLSS